MKTNEIILTSGSHASPDDGMCAMEAAAFLAQEEFSDHPVCACSVIGAAMRAFNDSRKWESNEQRTRVLMPYVERSIGTGPGSVGRVVVERAQAAAKCAQSFVDNFDASLAPHERIEKNAQTLLDALFEVK